MHSMLAYFSWFSWVGAGRFMVRLFFWILLTLSVFKVNVFAAPPVNGWWWNPLEPGSGYAIERQGSAVFMAAFLYEEGGAATWYASLLNLDQSGLYAGDLVRYEGGKSLLGSYKAPTSTSVIASVKAEFTSPERGLLKIDFPNGSTSRDIPISKFNFGERTLQAQKNNFQNGWWWNDKESGTGYFVEVQGENAFISSFMYDPSGQPTWYASSAVLSGGQNLFGPLDTYVGGQSLKGSYKSPKANAGAAGSVRYDFNAESAGIMTLPNNAKVVINRFVFDPAVTQRPSSLPTAGFDQRVFVGETVYLDSTLSNSMTGVMNYSWDFVNVPTGSSATLVNRGTAKPIFVPDVAGTYRISLVADNGKGQNLRSEVQVIADVKQSTNRAPVAHAGIGQNVVAGATVSLSGHLSSDSDGDSLTYAWFIVTKPAGSSARLESASTLSPRLVTDVPGSYVMGLVVNDGKAQSAQSTITVTVSAATSTSTDTSNASAGDLQGWPSPSKPITLIVPFAQGGASDGVARAIVSDIADKWNGVVVIDNKVGDRGNLGATAAATRSADGQHWLSISSSHAINRALNNSLLYDLENDFSAVAHVGGVPFVLLVSTNNPAKNLSEFIAQAGSRILKGGSNGNATLSHLLLELLATSMNVNFAHVPSTYNNIYNLSVGEVDFSFLSLSNALPRIQSGELRALAVTSAQRFLGISGVPTFVESGFNDLVAEEWIGYVMPAGTSQAVIDKVASLISSVLRSPSPIVAYKMASLNLNTRFMGPKAFDEFIKNEIARWRVIIKNRNIVL